MIFQFVFVVFFQVTKTLQQNYDEDIDRAYPITIYYHNLNVFSSHQIRQLYFDTNCTCRELGTMDTNCFGSSCNHFPININTTAIYFKLKLTSITIIHKDDFKNLRNVKLLDINSNAKLTILEPGCFRNMSNLQNLSIVANINLKYLAADVFEGLDNVENIYFQKNGFTHVIEVTQALTTKFVPRLQLLDLSESMFHQINIDEFHPMNGTSLTQLNLLLCELEFIHPECLLPLKNLRTLYLGQNVFNISSLTELIRTVSHARIPIDFLSLYDIGMRKIIPNILMEAIAASNITSLTLAANHFDYIDDESFPYMPNLIDLDLRNAYIGSISENAFKKLPALRKLHLGENKLVSVPKGALIEQIRFLDLAENTIEGVYFDMQEQIFAKMYKLENLQLSYNSMFCITNRSFAGLTNLLILNLKRTDLEHIEVGTFIHLKKLVHLNLMENRFTAPYINPDIFKGLENLQELLLGGCPIGNLTSSPNIFINMPNLKYLGLEKTNLHVIAPDQLSSLTHLHTLNLAENKLAAWSKQILPQNALKILYVQQNKITYFTDAMMEDYRYLDTIYLDDNPFSCDCSLFPVVTWIKENFSVNRTFVINYDLIAKCISPEEWRQKSATEYLNYLSNNQNQCIQDSSQLPIIIIISLFGIIVFVTICSVIVHKSNKFHRKTCEMEFCKV